MNYLFRWNCGLVRKFWAGKETGRRAEADKQGPGVCVSSGPYSFLGRCRAFRPLHRASSQLQRLHAPTPGSLSASVGPACARPAQNGSVTSECALKLRVVSSVLVVCLSIPLVVFFLSYVYSVL